MKKIAASRTGGPLLEFVRRRKYLLLAAAVLLAAFWVRSGIFSGPLEYDEIWTLENIVAHPEWRALVDLRTPNNHPLNSLFVKLWWSVYRTPQLIRIHSLVFGMLSVALVGVLARGLFHSRAAAFFAMLFMAFDAAAACYSGLARGYMTQIFFLLVFSCGLVWSGRMRKFLPWKYLPEAAVIVGALGAVFSVPTAPIFLAAALVGAKVCRRKLPEASIIIAVGIAWALIAAYLGLNYGALREAQGRFGVRFTDISQWFGFVLMLMQDFFSLAVVPFLLVLAAVDRKKGLLLLVCAFVIAASVWLVEAGPSRVYLPLCVLIALGCGRGAHALFTAALCYNNRRLAALLVLAAAGLAGYGFFTMQGQWHTDYWAWFDAGKSMPQDYLIVYPATAGLPLKWNNSPDMVRDQAARLEFAAAGERRLLCFGAGSGMLNGMDAAGAERPAMFVSAADAAKVPPEDRQRIVMLPGKPFWTMRKFNGFPAVEYKLYPAELPRPGMAFVAVSSTDAAEAARRAGAVLRMNPHLPGGLVFGVAPSAPAAWWDELRGSGAKFYTFEPNAR